ncbi:juvenile hormone esterase-like [Eriocheir sinensis]|uniref:juvenile hormone esterase-like n=1 Tax=Eriocheir sinensis TaxID=95602 RepID=UPI0021C66836|nr:juvenile hormone esterase-like [Eriocheir sinensis]XP_050713772.1 juvenile hormone esterase-like [Eriocheir sinensis]
MWRVVEVLVVVVALVAASDGSSEEERLVVQTEDGRVSGFREYSTKGRGFYSFLSIPYAKPPVGELRFQDPVAGEGWEGVRDGTKVAPVCPQIPFIALTKRDPVIVGEEDCLFLGVFSSMPSDRRLPVLVFLHGGGFFAGGANTYGGTVLMNEDVVLVLVQYRLGLLGFLSTEDSVMPGNYGLKDQTLALRWVQNNIHHFGGDPDRVTIFGESAGGASVHFHLLSPHSHELFARAIMMSGTLFSPWARGGGFKDVAKHTARLFGCPVPADAVDCPASKTQYCLLDDEEPGFSEAIMHCLQGVDAKNLTATLMDHAIFVFNPVLMGPRVDGDFLPAEPETLMAEGRHKHTDIISGVTAQEGALLALPLFSEDGLKSDLVDNFEEIGPGSLDLAVGDEAPVALARKIFDYYVGGVRVDEESADKICQLYGDRHFNLGHDYVSALHAHNAAPHKAYLYTLDHRGQQSFDQFYDTDVGRNWVSHVDDLFYIFSGGPVWAPLEREEDLRLRDIITKLWANFAAIGNPTPDDSLGFQWRAAESCDLQHLSLTPTPAMVGDRRREVRAFWETLPIKQNLLLNPDKVEHIHEGELGDTHDDQQPPTIKLRKWRARTEL